MHSGTKLPIAQWCEWYKLGLSPTHGESQSSNLDLSLLIRPLTTLIHFTFIILINTVQINRWVEIQPTMNSRQTRGTDNSMHSHLELPKLISEKTVNISQCNVISINVLQTTQHTD